MADFISESGDVGHDDLVKRYVRVDEHRAFDKRPDLPEVIGTLVMIAGTLALLAYAASGRVWVGQ